jgi:OFA family oxalate/formate antiporter-like MFS transporter
MKKYLALSGACVIFLFIGLIYAWSIFVPPLEAEFGWRRSDTSLTFTVSMTAFCAGMFAASALLKKLKPAFVVAASGGVILAGLYMTSGVDSLWQLYVYYGVFCGFPVGCVYNTLLSTVPLWFPRKVGLVNGVMLTFYGSGSLALGTLATYLMKIHGWRDTFKLLGAAIFAALFALSFLQPRLDMAVPGGPSGTDEAPAVSPVEMLKRSDFWLFFAWEVMTAAIGLSIIGHAAPLAKEAAVTSAMLPMAVGTVAVSSGLGRLLSGFLYDMIGLPKTLSAETALGLTGCVVLILCLMTRSSGLLFLGFALTGLSFGSAPAMNAVYVRKFYGGRHFAANFSIMGSSLMLSSIMGAYCIGLVRSVTSSYIPSLFMLAAYMGIAFASILPIVNSRSTQDLILFPTMKPRA